MADERWRDAISKLLAANRSVSAGVESRDVGQPAFKGSAGVGPVSVEGEYYRPTPEERPDWRAMLRYTRPLQEGAGFTDAYPKDVAPQTWVPRPYEGWRQSENVDDRQSHSALRGWAGAFGAEAAKTMTSMPETIKYFFPETTAPVQSQLSRDAGSDDIPMFDDTPTGTIYRRRY